MFSILFFLFTVSLIPMLIFAPWVPTRHSDIRRIAELAELKDTDVFYDLGSGDGKVLFGIAKISGCKLKGIESYIFLYLYSIIKKYLYYKSADISFVLGNIFSRDLSDASVIYVFGFPGKMNKLMKKLQKECKAGTRVISYSFEIEGLKVIKRDKPSERDLTIHVYEI